ncbi:MAG: hypothetical protein IKA25_03510 [Alphaproteobacteria bacterium]|nr:hypothetical protein [Alphaproteobacteria bacterium]MBR1954110.1 hypothetical protein [Alphaproteobacteria bacterium]
MKIDVNKIVKTNGIYFSQLWQDYYAVEVIVKVGEKYLRVRYPYNVRADAERTLEQIKQKKSEIKTPAYKPLVHWMDLQREKVL